MEPIPIQPQLILDSVDLSIKNSIYGNTSYQAFVGAFFPDQQLFKKQGYFFSYEFHVQRKGIFKVKKGKITFTDLSIAASTKENHRLGFGVMVVSGLNGSLTTVNTSIQCGFVTSSKPIYVESVTMYFLLNPHVFVALPIFLIAISLVYIQVTCCSKKYHLNDDIIEADTIALDDDSQEVPKKESRTFFTLNSNRDMEDKPLLGKAVQFFKNLAIHIVESTISLFSTSDSEIVRKCGTDVYYFLWFQKYLILFVTVCGAISMIILLPIYILSKQYDYSFRDFSMTTIASINVKTSILTILFFIMNGVIPVIGFGLLWKIRRLARHMIKANNNFGSLYTVMISNVDKTLKDKDILLRELRAMFGDNSIVDCHICFDYSKINALEKDIEILKTKLSLLDENRNGTINYIKSLHSKLVRNMSLQEYYTSEIEKSETKLSELKKENEICGTGFAFATFSSLKMAQQVCDEYVTDFMGFMVSKKYILNKFARIKSYLTNSPSAVPSIRNSYNFKPACEAVDVMYDNLQCTTSERTLTNIVSNALLTFILIIAYAILIFNSSIPWYFNQNKSEVYDFADGSKYSTNTIFNSLLVFFELTPEIISLINESIKPIVEKLVAWEKPKTRMHERKSILRRTTYFFIMSTIIFPYAWTYYKSVWRIFKSLPPFNNEIYFFNFIGIELIITTLVLACTSKGLDMIFTSISMLYDYWRTGELHRPKFDYEAEYSIKITLLIMCLFYGTCMPLVYIAVVLYFIFTYIVEKYLIMYWYERSIESDGKILNTVAENIGFCFILSPFYIIVLMPVLLSRKMTYLLGIPIVILIIIELYFLIRKTANKERDAIIISLKERSEQSHKKEDTVEELDTTPTNNTPTNIQDASEYTRKNIEEDHDFIKLEQNDWFEHSLQDKRDPPTFDKLHEILNTEETRIFEDLNLDVNKLSRAYRHPL